MILAYGQAFPSPRHPGPKITHPSFYKSSIRDVFLNIRTSILDIKDTQVEKSIFGARSLDATPWHSGML